MEEKILVDRILKELQKSELTSEYFKSNIKWLQERLTYWDKNYIRVGIIGVTSSGKSTMLNAFLGEKLLPAAVRPTSGGLITCSKSDKREATIYFENSLKKSFIGKNLNSNIIEKYGDEKLNPHNRERVKYIDIRLPNFALNSNIQLVDSPGLDAYGLERHEKLTLEILLPSIDICVYLTTLKANSDKTTARILKTIENYNKPFIIVQNMLDSVEPKLGRNGIIQKTRKEVAQEHKSRVSKVLERANISKEKLVGIIQVSSKNALIGRTNGLNKLIEQSGFDNLVFCIEETVKKLQPLITKQRIIQIKKHLEEIVDEEKKKVTEIKALNKRNDQIETKIKSLRDNYFEILNNFNTGYKKIYHGLSKIKDNIDNGIAEISELDCYNINKGRSLLKKLKKSIENIEDIIYKTVKNFNNDIDNFLKFLNLSKDDYIDFKPRNQSKRKKAFTFKTTVDKKPISRKQRGMLGGVKRFFGSIFKKDWGWEKDIEEIEVLDIDRTIQGLDSYCKVITNEYKSVLENWKEKSLELLEISDEEIMRRKEGIKRKQESVLKKEETLKIINKLDQILKEINKLYIENKQMNLYKTINGNDEIATTSELRDLKVSQGVLAMVELSNFIISKIFAQLWDVIQSANKKTIGAYNITVVWGWDNSSIDSFITRYLNVNLENRVNIKLNKEGFAEMMLNDHKLLIVNELYLNIDSIKEIQDILIENKYNVYVLANAMQQGSAIKQIMNSNLKKLSSVSKGVVNWVIQSLNEFIFDDNIEEAIISIIDISKECNYMEKGLYLINHRTPIYSMVLLELQNKKDITISVENDIIKNLTKYCSYLINSNTDKINISKIIKTYSRHAGGDQID